MSVTNCLKFGMRRAQPGLLGVATGTFVVACLSATGLGLLLKASAVLYDFVRYVGVFFLLYLAWRYLQAPAFDLQGQIDTMKVKRFSARKLFVNGVLLQISNPALLIFYVSLYPQCIDPRASYMTQFFVLNVTYFLLVYLLHSLYGILTLKLSRGFFSGEHSLWINRVAALSFTGIALVVLWQVLAPRVS